MESRQHVLQRCASVQSISMTKTRHHRTDEISYGSPRNDWQFDASRLRKDLFQQSQQGSRQADPLGTVIYFLPFKIFCSMSVWHGLASDPPLPPPVPVSRALAAVGASTASVAAAEGGGEGGGGGRCGKDGRHPSSVRGGGEARP